MKIAGDCFIPSYHKKNKSKIMITFPFFLLFSQLSRTPQRKLNKWHFQRAEWICNDFNTSYLKLGACCAAGEISHKRNKKKKTRAIGKPIHSWLCSEFRVILITPCPGVTKTFSFCFITKFVVCVIFIRRNSIKYYKKKKKE